MAVVSTRIRLLVEENLEHPAVVDEAVAVDSEVAADEAAAVADLAGAAGDEVKASAAQD
jgi:hypothetical protein